MATDRRFTYLDCTKEEAKPLFNVSRSALITAADNQTDCFWTEKGHYFELYQEGNVTTSILHNKNATGWQIFDLDTDSDSIQYSQGILATTTRDKFTVGSASDTGDAFYLKVKLDITTVSEYDVAAVGFRKLAAYADVADAAAMGTAYEDVAALNCNAGTIYSVTRLAAGTATLTSTTNTWADAAQKTLEVYVSNAGVVTFQIDGAAPTVNTNTLTLTDNAVMIPFMVFTATGDTGSSMIELISYECGLQQ
jgi:hypothetical protein